jgi:RHS repeat-associated protein
LGSTPPINPARRIGFTDYDRNTADDPSADSGQALGLIFMNARYYLPYMNRFISTDTIVPDPTNPQQFNRYTYGLNNPLRYTDPTGHFSEEAIYDYILNHECAASVHCADDMVLQWSQNGAWWLMLLTASANDVLYGMIQGGPGMFTFMGAGMQRLDGITTDFGVKIRLSSFLSGSYTIPQIIDASGRIATGVPAVTHSVGWEALGFHMTGQVLLQEDFANAHGVLVQIYGSQYIPPTVRSVASAALTASSISLARSVACGMAGYGTPCSLIISGIQGALEASRPQSPEQFDIVRNTRTWSFVYKPSLPLTVNQMPDGTFYAPVTWSLDRAVPR